MALVIFTLLAGCASTSRAPAPAAPKAASGPRASAPSATAAAPAAATPVELAAPTQAVPAAPAPAPAATAPPTPPPLPAPAPAPVPSASARAAAEPAAQPVATSAPAVSLQGRIELTGRGDFKPIDGDAARTVVYFVPESGAARPSPGRYSIYTQGKAFDLPYLVVQAGSTIAFPNNDPIRHNVYSATPGSAFDLGFYGEGESREQRFERPGVVVVNCNVHHTMQAEVLVLPNAHHTLAAADGRFRLTGLPAGRGTLFLWHPRASLQSMPIALPATQVLMPRLALTRPRLGG